MPAIAFSSYTLNLTFPSLAGIFPDAIERGRVLPHGGMGSAIYIAVADSKVPPVVGRRQLSFSRLSKSLTLLVADGELPRENAAKRVRHV